jgi:glyoxylase-like metal-dependent hydrolase (beta-lactamase superfamily II)
MTKVKDDSRVRQLDTRPEDGNTLEVAPGVQWLRMPLPFVLNHINLWVLDDGPGWCLVDTGINAASTRAVWEKLLDGPLADRPITRVIVTHLHPDHVGLAGWLTARTGARLHMTRGEYLSARVLAADSAPPPPEALDFYRAAGFDPVQLDNYAERFGRFGRLVSPLPITYARLADNDELQIGGRRWQVLIGRGHSPEHACLYCAELNVLIAGDQALPTISPNVSVWPTEPHANPLADWLESCRELPNRMPADVLVLPAHGRPYHGLGKRMARLITEHEEGLDAIRRLCNEPRRAVDLFGALFRGAVNSSNEVMAAGEALAHLAYLEAAGELVAEADELGARWYQRT